MNFDPGVSMFFGNRSLVEIRLSQGFFCSRPGAPLNFRHVTGLTYYPDSAALPTWVRWGPIALPKQPFPTFLPLLAVTPVQHAYRSPLLCSKCHYKFRPIYLGRLRRERSDVR